MFESKVSLLLSDSPFIFKSSATSRKLDRSSSETFTSPWYMKFIKFSRVLYFILLRYITGFGFWFDLSIFFNTGLHAEMITLWARICLSLHASVTSQKSFSDCNCCQDVLTLLSNSFKRRQKLSAPVMF